MQCQCQCQACDAEGKQVQPAVSRQQWSDAGLRSALLICLPALQMKLRVLHTARPPMPHACRIILAGASPVFAAMWGGAAREAAQQRAVLDAEPAVACALLRHMYGGEGCVSLQQLPELWCLADYYQVGVWGVGVGVGGHRLADCYSYRAQA